MVLLVIHKSVFLFLHDFARDNSVVGVGTRKRSEWLLTIIPLSPSRLS